MQYDEAIADFTQAIQLQPDNVVAYTNRGAAYADNWELDRAIADFTQAITLNPRDANAYFNRGVTYAQRGDSADVIADFKQVLALTTDPDLQRDARQQLAELEN